MTSDSRKAERRARYLAGTTDLEYRKALALAHSERCYSYQAIADKIGSTRGTVEKYLDEIAEKYGDETRVLHDVDRTSDLVPIEEQPPKVPLEVPNTGRKVILEGESPTPHSVERFFRTWRDDGRTHRDEKVALSLSAYDDSEPQRLGDVEWDEYHCRYDPDYEFVSCLESGAWTFDATQATRDRIREIVHVPQLEEIPLVGETVPRRADEDPFRCTNPDCDDDRAHSAEDLDAYPRLSGAGIEVVGRSDVVSHICLSCRSLIETIPVGSIDSDSDSDSDSHRKNDTLAGATQ